MSYGFINWFSKTSVIKTQDNHNIDIYAFNHINNQKLLSEWATHFRNMYCDDSLIDEFRRGTGLSRSEYLLQMVFPDETDNFGPATRSGDFAELLVADFLEFIQKYWIPRIRYDDKATRNSSTQGSDVVGIKLKKTNGFDKNDELLVFEVKAQFSGDKPKPRLQDAIDDSNKDVTRVGEFLNYAKRRYIKEHNIKDKKIIERFQNISDNPYIERFGAAALFTDNIYNVNIIKTSDCSKHKKNNKLLLLVISGKEMMTLVHSLYKRAADEA